MGHAVSRWDAALIEVAAACRQWGCGARVDGCHMEGKVFVLKQACMSLLDFVAIVMCWF